MALLTVGLLTAPAAQAWKPHIRQASAYAATRAGGISFGVRTERRLRGVGVRRTVPSASALKPMLLVAYLRGGRTTRRDDAPDEASAPLDAEPGALALAPVTAPRAP